MKDYTNFTDIAKEYSKEKLNNIKNEAKKRSRFLPQLAYLLNQLSEQRELLHPMQLMKRSDLKSGIISAYENDKVYEYHNSKQIDDDYSKLIEVIEDRKKYCHNPKGLTVKEYIEINQAVFPFEYSDASLKKNTKKHESLNIDLVAGIVYGQILLLNDIEDEIRDIIYENQPTKEDLEDLKILLNNKIKWNEGLNEFAHIFNILMNKNYIEIPTDNTSPKKADLFHAHFYIDGKRGEESSVRSMKDAFNNVNVKAKGLSNLKKEKIRDLFN